MPNKSPISLKDPASFAWTIGAVLFAGMLCLFLLGRKPPTVTEVLSSELTRREGLLYQGDMKKPFTGVMLEKYAGGGLKSRSTVHDGFLDGLSEGRHTNGQVQVREFFKKGVSHGLREKWSENGVKLSAGPIVEGKHEGIFRRWHENGALAEEVTMRQGEPDGLSRSFYPSGFLKAQVTLKSGKVVEQKSWADGEVKESLGVASSK